MIFEVLVTQYLDVLRPIAFVGSMGKRRDLQRVKGECFSRTGTS